MTSGIATALIAGGSALGGGTIVAVSNYATNRAAARGGHKTELRRALSAFLYVISRIDHQLRVEPRRGKTVQTFNKQLARFPHADYITERLHRRLFEPRLDDLVDRMHEAMATTILIAPLELIPALSAVSDLMTQAEAMDDEWREKWDTARGELVVACRTALGETVGPR